jgi:transcription elongation factor Elf1
MSTAFTCIRCGKYRLGSYNPNFPLPKSVKMCKCRENKSWVFPTEDNMKEIHCSSCGKTMGFESDKTYEHWYGFFCSKKCFKIEWNGVVE